jgi:hypothetical protein
MEPEGSYSVQKWLPPVPFLTQMNAVYNIQTHFFEVRFSIILKSMPRCSGCKSGSRVKENCNPKRHFEPPEILNPFTTM